MGLDFKIPLFMVGFLVISGIRIPYMLRSRRIARVEKRVGFLEQSLSLFDWLTMFIMPLLFVFVAKVRLFPYGLNGRESLALALAGAAIFLLAIWLFFRAHKDLGDNWSTTLEIRKNQVVVNHGVYRHIRHPMYAACLLWGLAQAFLLQDWVFGPSCFFGALFLFGLRVRPEERMMLDRFGEAYRDYMRTTGRIFPRWT